MRLCKLLMLTTSDSDGETLNAIRQANAHLKKSGKTWQDLFGVNVKNEPTPIQRATEIAGMLEIVLKEVKGPSREFIESLAKQFKNRGSLSEKQYNALVKFYWNCI